MVVQRDARADARHVAQSFREGYQPVTRLPVPPPRRAPRDVVGAITAALALAAVVLGVPAALVLLVGNPFPTRMPTRDWLAAEISFTAIINIFAVVVWLAWFHFTVCVISEWRSARRGRLPSRVPLGGGSQLLARRLVAAVLLLGGAVTLVPPPAPAPAPRPAAVSVLPTTPSAAQQTPGATDPATASTPTSAPSASAEASSRVGAVGGQDPSSAVKSSPEAAPVLWYEVRPPHGRRHDCLWDIAERTLGDPFRYKEIFALNRNRVQADGRRLVDADLIQPGWMLVMPSDARGPGITAVDPVRTPVSRSRSGAGQAADPAAGEVAAGEVTDPAAGVATGSGITDPTDAGSAGGTDASAREDDRGPGAGSGATDPLDPSSGGPGSPDGGPGGGLDSGADSGLGAGSGGDPGVGADGGTGAGVGLDGGQGALPADEATAGQVVADDTEAPGPARGLLGGGLLLAGVLTALSARRGPYGDPRDDGSDPLRLAADPERSALLDRALRHLAAGRSADGLPLPDVLVAQVGVDDVVLHLAPGSAEPGRPPAPWRAEQDGRSWSVTADDLDAAGVDAVGGGSATGVSSAAGVASPAGVDAVGGGSASGGTTDPALVAAPYPALVNVASADGHEILVDLEASPGLVAVCGQPDRAREVAASMAVELATNGWSDGVRVTLVGFGDDLSAVAPRLITHVDRLADLLDDVETDDARQTELLATLGMHGVLSGRVVRGSQRWRPHVLVLSGPPTPEEATRLHAVVGRGRSPLAVVCVGETPAARWRFVVGQDGSLEIALLGVRGTARRLPPVAYRALADLFRAAERERSRSAQVVAGLTPQGAALAALGAGDDPDPDGPASAQALAAIQVPLFGMDGAPVAVRLLGPVRVDVHPSVARGTRPVEAARLALLTEVVVAAALHRDGLHDAVLRSVIWPRGVDDDVVARTVREVQDWLGYDAFGGPRLRVGRDGRWRLADDVVCDWDVFRALVAGGQGTGEASGLRSALALARGEVFSAVPAGHYGWLAFHSAARDARVVVTAAARRAAALAEALGRPQDAVQALDFGLRLVPTGEALWRDRLRLASHEGPAAVEETARRMDETLRRRGVATEPETDALLEALAPGFRNRTA